jgi:hypothetical protein
MEGNPEPERLRAIAAHVAAAHPLITRLLALDPRPEQPQPPAAVQWIVVVARRERRAEAAIVRALEAATASPCEVFIVDERSYRVRERTASMAAALRRAVTLFSRAPASQDFGRSP